MPGVWWSGVLQGGCESARVAASLGVGLCDRMLCWITLGERVIRVQVGIDFRIKRELSLAVK